VSERVPGAGNGKITAAHRRRDAVIYVRQSTLAQTQENTESLALQYELRRHATELGWSEQQITVIDEDLARSAASTSGRPSRCCAPASRASASTASVRGMSLRTSTSATIPAAGR